MKISNTCEQRRLKIMMQRQGIEKYVQERSYTFWMGGFSVQKQLSHAEEEEFCMQHQAHGGEFEPPNSP